MGAVGDAVRHPPRLTPEWRQDVLPGFARFPPGTAPRPFPPNLATGRVGDVLLRAWHPRSRQQLVRDAKRLHSALALLEHEVFESKTHWSRFCPWNAQRILASYRLIRFDTTRYPHVLKRPRLTEEGAAFLAELERALRGL